VPHNTAAAASATGTPTPIEGAGAGQRRLQQGLASANVAAARKNPLANVNNLTPPSSIGRLQPIIMYHSRQVISDPLTEIDQFRLARRRVPEFPQEFGQTDSIAPIFVT
jgi:hypothetical protein